MKSKKQAKTRGINTQLTHGGYDPHSYHGFINPPVVHASTVLFPDAETMKTRDQAYTYGTRGTPTTDALASAINELEGAVGTIMVPSGLAAVTVPLLAFLSAGDHLLIIDTVYNPTRRFVDDVLTRYGVEVEYYVPELGAEIEAYVKPNTRVIFMETPGSNTFEMQDIPAIVEIAKAHDIITMIDNTYATPLFFKPLEFGVDVSIAAATKYQSGHSDLVYGLVSANEKTWQQLWDTQLTLGVCPSPDDTFLVYRGLRTMGLRVKRHEETTNRLAAWLEGHDGIHDVLHPALKSHPGHAIWKRDFKGSTGLFSIVLRRQSEAAVHAFLNELQLFGLGYSWGGYESLAVHVNLSDRTVSKRDYGGPIIRLNVGLEDFEDLQLDLDRAIAAAAVAEQS
ncbi:MAG: cystathionine beta-lyase [Pseudomonadota bacterium]